MKNKILRQKFWVRFAAYFLFLSMIICLVTGFLLTLYAASSGYFLDNGNSDREDIRSYFAFRYASNVLQDYCTNSDEIYAFNSGYFYYVNTPLDTDNVDYVITKTSNNTVVESSLKRNLATYAQSHDYRIEVKYNPNENKDATITEEFLVTIHYPHESPYQDSYTTAIKLSKLLSDLKYIIAISILFSLIASVALYIFLLQSAGISSEGEYTPGFLGRIPIELFACIITAIEIGAVGLSTLIAENFHSFANSIPSIILFSFVSLLMLTWLSMSLAARIRSKTFFKYCLTWIILKAIGRFIRLLWRIYHKAGFLWRSALILAVVSFILLISVIVIFAEEPVGLILIFLLWVNLSIMFSIACANLAKLKKAIHRLANGDYTAKVSTFGMLFDFRRAAHNINSIFDGMNHAVEERTKSEKMKSELITNVSHDIKTPLTSIVNCVDLMKNSGEEYSEQTKEYLDILDRQSLRLKKLTEDVLEASKASTGNVKVELSPVDMSLLISQALGEYADKLEENNINPIVNVHSTETYALADGRLLWRVLDNIFSNIKRYSLPGTRAHVDLFCEKDKVIATFKNISSYELPKDPSELTERFVRADSSRNTEGSGLGLSISEDLCALMGGKLTISTEADLFKVAIELPSCTSAPPNK